MLSNEKHSPGALVLGEVFVSYLLPLSHAISLHSFSMPFPSTTPSKNHCLPGVGGNASTTCMFVPTGGCFQGDDEYCEKALRRGIVGSVYNFPCSNVIYPLPCGFLQVLYQQRAHHAAFRYLRGRRCLSGIVYSIHKNNNKKLNSTFRWHFLRWC